MRRFASIALFAALAAISAAGQKPSVPAPPAKPAPPPERVKVYSVGNGITAPVLLPSIFDIESEKKCENKTEARIAFYILIDAAGRARNIIFNRPLGSDVDKLALQIVESDRFTPGSLDGKPVTVAQIIEVNLQICEEESKDKFGRKSDGWRLKSIPKQTLKKFPNPPAEAVFSPLTPAAVKSAAAAARPDYFGGAVTAPVLIFSVEADYPWQAWRQSIEGVCVVSLTVDARGLPENVKVLRRLFPSLDKSAVAAVKNYRFIPAFKNDEPVPATISVDVHFTMPELD